MTRATWSQTSFLGGVWSPFMQGRVDHPKYKMALATMQNALPTEEGAFQRRPGFKHVCRTGTQGSAAILLPFTTQASTPYKIELTNSHLRMLNGTTLVGRDDSVTVSAISTANPAVVTIASDKGWATGDEIVFGFDTAGAKGYPDVAPLLKNRTFTVTKLTGVTYSLQDAITGANVTGAGLNVDVVHVPMTAYSIANKTTVYTGTTAFQSVRIAQNQTTAVLFQNSFQPYTVAFTAGSSTSQGTIALTAADILDGPYLDIDLTGAYLVPHLADATKTRVVQFYVSFPTWVATTPYKINSLVQYDDGGGILAYQSLTNSNINHAPAAGGTAYWSVVDAGVINGSGGFTSADIGRCVRLFSQPPLWAVGTTYSIGTAVTYNGLFYVSSTNTNLGNKPDISLDNWTPTTSQTVATWTWGRITAVGTGTNPRFTLDILGPVLLYQDTGTTYNIYSFRLGLYGSPGVHWPTNGVFHQGRLWFAGALPNRLDGSKPNEYFNFEPTGADGTVADNNAITATFNARTSNAVQWMESADQGIICGTDGGEWLVQASNLNDPLTPTSIQAHQKTTYGCAAVAPVRAGIALVFLQKFKRKMLEYLADVFSGKYSAPNLSEPARHMTQSSAEQIVYQEEPVPIIWTRCSGYRTNSLAGMTYRRTSAFVSEAPSLSAWFDVVPGSTQSFTSLCVTPSTDGTSSVLTAVVYDAYATLNHIVEMSPIGDERQDIYTSNYVDDGVTPPPMFATTSAGVSGIRIYGLWHLNGQSVDVWLGGVDAGTYTVASGTIFVPYGSDPGGLLTLANLQSLSASGEDFGAVGTYFSAGSGATSYYVPCVVGHTFTTIGKALRPGLPQDVGTPLGLPLGKTRRAHRYALQVSGAISGTVSIGTNDATNLKTVSFYGADDQTELSKSSAFTGVISDVLDDDYGLDSMLYWKLTRPYPFTLLGASTFLEGQER